MLFLELFPVLFLRFCFKQISAEWEGIDGGSSAWLLLLGVWLVFLYGYPRYLVVEVNWVCLPLNQMNRWVAPSRPNTLIWTLSCWPLLYLFFFQFSWASQKFRLIGTNALSIPCRTSSRYQASPPLLLLAALISVPPASCWPPDAQLPITCKIRRE